MTLRALLFTGLIWPIAVSWAAAAPLPAPFEARYEGTAVVANVTISGELVMTLSHDGRGQYRMTSDIQPGGLASLFATMSESAHGELRDGSIRPLRYEHEVSGVKPSRTEVDFDWQQGVLHARHEDERATLPLAPRVVDPLSLNLLVMTDLLRGDARERYTYVDDTDLKTYRISRDGNEVLQTPIGSLQTIRLSQSRAGKSRITRLWFAPSLNYLPVKIVQEKKGKEVLRMVIREVKVLDPK